MDDEFTVAGKYKISSKNGFAVDLSLSGWIAYHDSRGESRIGAERLARPPQGVVLYANDRLNVFPAGIDETEKDKIVDAIIRALRHLGFEVERQPACDVGRFTIFRVFGMRFMLYPNVQAVSIVMVPTCQAGSWNVWGSAVVCK